TSRRHQAGPVQRALEGGTTGYNVPSASTSMPPSAFLLTSGCTGFKERSLARSCTEATDPAEARLWSIASVGGSTSLSPRAWASITCPGSIQLATSDSELTERACAPGGSVATKNQVSYRRCSTGGVTQRAQGWSEPASRV